jgi:capsular exopolysaccharide synthesis family protein
MNDRPVIHAPDPGGRGILWLDQYLPDGQMVSAQPKPQLININAIRGLFFRQRWLIIGVIVAALLAGLITTLIATPMYRAESTVKVDPAESYIVEGQNIDLGYSSNQIYDYLSTQLAVIKSRMLADTIASDLKLGERYDLFDKNIDEQRPPNMSDAQWVEAKEKMAGAQLQASVRPEMPDGNWVITIGYISESPVLAAEMANAYANAFVASGSRTKLEQNQYAQEFLRGEIQEIRRKLESAEQAANAYARNSGLIMQQTQTDDGESTVTLTSANLVDINARVSAARAARIAAEQRWRSIQNLPAGQLTEVQSNPVLQELTSQRTSKQTQLIELRQRYNDNFPQIASLLDQIDILDKQIAALNAEIKASVRSAYVIARNQEQALDRELQSLTGKTLVEQDEQVQYGVLEREAQALRDQLKMLLDRYNQISSAANIESDEFAKLDSATVPTSPYSPDLARNLLLALVLGVACAGGLAVLRETFDDRIRSLDDVEDRVGLPLLGHTPFVELRDMDKGADRSGALIEAYSSIRSAIDFTLPRNQNVIQLTSSRAGEGKSTTAVILAELFASLGRKTLLIDGDLRRPSIARLVGVEKPQSGLVEVVLGHTDLEQALIKGMHDNLDILPIGSITPNPTELLSLPEMREFIERCRQEYSMVIIDSCPVLGLADSPMIASLVDATIFVLEANKVPFGQARAAIRRLRMGNGHLLGTILTKYHALNAGQSYDYQYGYYQYGDGKD